MDRSSQNPISASDQEIQEFFRILRKNPRSRVFASLADALLSRRMLQDAETVCKLGISANPDFSDGFLAYARVLYGQSRLLEASQHIQKALDLNPSRVDAFLLQAEIYIADNNLEAASRSCMHALDIDAQNPRLREILSQIKANSQLPLSAKPVEGSFQSRLGTMPSQRVIENEIATNSNQSFSQLTSNSQPEMIDADPNKPSVWLTIHWAQGIIDKYSKENTPDEVSSLSTFRIFYLSKILLSLSVLIVLAGLAALLVYQLAE